MPARQPGEFERADDQKQLGIVAEFIGFLGENKKFWLIPLLLSLLAIGGLLVFGGTAAAPFIYTLF